MSTIILAAVSPAAMKGLGEYPTIGLIQVIVVRAYRRLISLGFVVFRDTQPANAGLIALRQRYLRE